MKKIMMIATTLMISHFAHAGDCSEKLIKNAVNQLNSVNGIHDRKITKIELVKQGQYGNTYQLMTRDSDDNYFIFSVTTWKRGPGSCQISKVEDMGET